MIMPMMLGVMPHSLNGSDQEVDATKRIKAKKLRILVVDDEAEFRAGVVSTLRDIYGVLASGADSVADAKRQLGHGRFDLILMDVNMPVVNGIDACRQMLASGTLTRFVLMSAYDHRGPVEAMGLPFFDKPDTWEPLKNLLLELARATLPLT